MEPRTDQRATVRQLFADNSDRLRQYLRSRLANEHDAQELAQEAYLRMLRIKRLDFVRNPEAYLFRIAKNLVHELYSGRRIGVSGDVDLDTIESDDPSLEELAVLSARRRQVERALAELSPKCKAAVMLQWREGLTQLEIAERMNLSRSMVQKYLAAGLLHCQKRLRRSVEADRGKR